MTTYHEAGPLDPVSCEVRCVRCGLLLMPAETWQSEVWAWDAAAGVERFVGLKELRAPFAFRPRPGQIVAMEGNGPYYGQHRSDKQPTCRTVARVA